MKRSILVTLFVLLGALVVPSVASAVDTDGVFCAADCSDALAVDFTVDSPDVETTGTVDAEDAPATVSKCEQAATLDTHTCDTFDVCDYNDPASLLTTTHDDFTAIRTDACMNLDGNTFDSNTGTLHITERGVIVVGGDYSNERAATAARSIPLASLRPFLTAPTRYLTRPATGHDQ